MAQGGTLTQGDTMTQRGFLTQGGSMAQGGSLTQVGLHGSAIRYCDTRYYFYHYYKLADDMHTGRNSKLHQPRDHQPFKRMP